VAVLAGVVWEGVVWEGVVLAGVVLEGVLLLSEEKMELWEADVETEIVSIFSVVRVVEGFCPAIKISEFWGSDVREGGGGTEEVFL
jgi:hypothetical protein